MQFFYFTFKLAEIQMVFNSAYIQPGFHDLFNGNISKFDNSFQYIFFFFGGIVVNCMIKFFEAVGCRSLATKKPFKFFRLVGEENTKSSEKKVNDFGNAGCIKC